MEEVKTGGGKEFIISVVWVIILLFIGDIIVSALPDYKIIGIIITILMLCVLGFFVLTRYSAVYTYSVKNGRMKVNRKIGYRNKEIEFRVSDVISVTKHRPGVSVNNVYNMHTKIFSKRNIWYIVYRKNTADNMLVCGISKKMADEIRSEAQLS